MGNCIRSMFRSRKIRRQIVLILIGLDNAGKTKTVNNLTGDQDEKVLPTVGFKAVNLIHKDTPVTIYDLGGASHFRQIWSQYYSEVHGVIFVIDSSDFSRLDECRTVFEEVLSHDKISGKPVLVLANKQDKTGALDDIDVVEKLNIEPLVNRYRCPTLVESYTANKETKTGKVKVDPGLKRGYLWLLNYILSRYGDLNLRVQTDINMELERRKRMQIKSTGSQTVSDDLTTQTGFENPNCILNKTQEETENSDYALDNTQEKIVEGVLVVKPVTHKNNSIDTTITIESVDDSDNTSAKPKLSPLFGMASDNSLTEARIELEHRSEYRKLSPIVRNKNCVNHIDFLNRPHSSPTSKIKCSLPSKNSSLDESKSVATSSLAADRTRTYEPADRHRVLVKDIELSQMHREIVLTERDYSSKHSASEAHQTSSLPAARPASASALVRRQLELCCQTQHKRRLSLRYMHRNKTSPERATMLIYEPGKTPQRQLDKGDFEHVAHLY